MSAPVSFAKLVETAAAFDKTSLAVKDEPKFVAYRAQKKNFGAVVKGDPVFARAQLDTLSGKALKKSNEWLKKAKDDQKSEMDSDTFTTAHKAFNAAFEIVKDVETYQAARVAKKAFKAEVFKLVHDGVSVEAMQSALTDAGASARAVNRIAYYKIKA